MKKTSVIILGSGNVAAFLSRNISARGMKVERIVARNAAKGKSLAAEIGASWEEHYSGSNDENTIIISAVKDSAAQTLWEECDFKNNLVLHTAGALPLSALQKYAKNCGVLYPLQTISEKRPIPSPQVPFFIEGNSEENLARIKEVAEILSPMVQVCDSAAREKLHLAAVFANNFANLCFRMAWEIAEKEGLPPQLLLPLIEETCAKLRTLSPHDAQTGPAVRWDENIMAKHLELLKEMPEKAAFYTTASAEIHRRSE